jgi:hypothetical protein
MLFGQLLSRLPDEYSTTREIIDSQPSLSTQEKLNILKNREERLDKAEKALAAQSALQTPYRSKHQSKHDSGSESESRQNLTCWICDTCKHLVQDCPTLLQFQTIVKKLTTASLQIEKSKAQSSRSAKQKDKSVKDKTISVKPSSRCYKGHVADNDLSDTDTELPDTDSSDSDNEEEEAVEVAANSRDLGKVTLSQWISDTGATTYITDQCQLFRLLVPVKRCTIRVGEGKLYL